MQGVMGLAAGQEKSAAAALLRRQIEPVHRQLI
jgi:hypothetical protein